MRGGSPRFAQQRLSSGAIHPSPIMKFQCDINFNRNYWLHRLFPFLKCKHKVVSVEENFESRYGCRISYKYCLKCGRDAIDIERNCKHEETSFGECKLCLMRLRYPCNENHEWVQEPDTDDFFCEKCGEWRE